MNVLWFKINFSELELQKWMTDSMENQYLCQEQTAWKIWDKIIYWQERKNVFCLRDAKTRRDWNKVRKLLILKVNLTFLIFKGVKLSRPLKLSQRVLLLKAREFLYFWCHFAHSWYIQCNNKISHKYNNVEENIWLVKKENWYNLILSVKGYYNRRFMENWDHNQSWYQMSSSTAAPCM